MAAFAPAVYAASPEEPAVQGIPPAPAGDQIVETNAQEVARAFLQLQDQFRATQVALEQNRRETRAAAVQTAETLSNALQAIQEASYAITLQQLCDRLTFLLDEGGYPQHPQLEGTASNKKRLIFT